MGVYRHSCKYIKIYRKLLYKTTAIMKYYIAPTAVGTIAVVFAALLEGRFRLSRC